MSANEKVTQTGDVRDVDPGVMINEGKKTINNVLQGRLTLLNSRHNKIPKKRVSKKKVRKVNKRSIKENEKVHNKKDLPHRVSNRYFEGMLVGSFLGAALTSLITKLFTEI
ncbi:hypothetical protein RNJ44_04732 [Nakaseomyces bracarensis]|uniref:Uncharacterized protein n=1 Tax=Nakaseomyces bracarensis TaxID=273131 RepID=A0ABR4NW56_9SACH